MITNDPLLSNVDTTDHPLPVKTFKTSLRKWREEYRAHRESQRTAASPVQRAGSPQALSYRDASVFPA